MTYSSAVLASTPGSYWRLGDQVGAPAGVGADPYAGLVYGDQGDPTDPRISLNPLRSPWQYWGWGNAVNLQYSNSGADLADDIASSRWRYIGPYGIFWQPIRGDEGLYFRYDPPAFDWTPFTHLMLWIKNDTTNVTQFQVFIQRDYVTIGSAVLFVPPANAASATVPVYVTLRTPAGTGSVGALNLSGGNVTDLILQIGHASTLVPDGPIYVDEVQFVATRANYNPLGVGTYTELRTDNFVPNHMVLLSKPANLLTGDAMDPYRAAMAGDMAGDTQAILEWSAKKWGFGSTPSPLGGAPLNVPDIAKAISQLESNWHQSAISDYERWAWVGSNDGSLDTPFYAPHSFGIGQNKSPKYWPPWRNMLLSTAYNSENHIAAVRAHYDGALYTGSPSQQHPINSSVPNPTRLRRAVNAWFAGSGTCADGVNDGADSFYTCCIMGGTVRENGNAWNGVTLTGFINRKEWLSATVDVNFANALP